MKNYVSESDTITLAAPSGGVVSGTPTLIGNLFGVPVTTAAEGELFALATEGVYTLTKKSTDVLTVGLVVYWDTTNHYVTLTKTSNYRIGVATAAAANPSSTVTVRLDGVAVIQEAGA